MAYSNPRRWFTALLLANCLAFPCLAAGPGAGTDFGRVWGMVTDTQGNPLMGAAVLIMGPLGLTPYRVQSAAEGVITDAHGEFAVEHLVPGRYSLRVTSPTRLPFQRSDVRVQAGQTSRQTFTLSDIFLPLRIQVPSTKVSSWGEDWKWVLRTSATTRPVLRYQEVAQATIPPHKNKNSKKTLPPSRRLVGMIPGSARREALADDPGLGNVLAYLRPLSENSDLLVAGSMTATGLQASSLATSFRNHVLKGDTQELALVVHQLNFSDGLPFAAKGGSQGLTRAQGVVFNYSHSRRLSDSLTLTTGFDAHYLNAARDVLAASPRMKLEYSMAPSTTLAIRYGTIRLDDGSDTLLERVGMLNAFPRVTLRGYHPRLEELNHAEVSVHRKLSKTSRAEVAAYRDYFRNAAVWGLGTPGLLTWVTGNALPNPAANGVTLNAGDYHSSGLRSTYSLSMGSRTEAAFTYAFGQALIVDAAHRASGDAQRSFRGILRPDRSQSIGGKVSTRVPISNTQIITSYEWLQRGSVTGVDPYGQADLQLQPFLGFQIRQPLPTLAFFPARIEALADFRNLLRQGYVPLAQSGENPFLLTSSYRSFRGGFSVLF